MDAEKKREGVKNVSLARPFFEAALEGWEMRVYTYCTGDRARGWKQLARRCGEQHM